MPRSKLVIALAVLVSLTAVCWAQAPESAIKRYQKGMSLKRTGAVNQAIAEMKAAVGLYPKYMEAHYALGWLYRQVGASDKAVEEFREVIRIAPQSPEAIESARAIQRIRLGPDYSGGTEAARIAFASERAGNTDIYAMDVNGGGLIRLTAHPAVDDSPAWSPDGRRIAFVSERDGNREVYVTTLDGSEVQRITDNSASDSHPVWSPDGRQIAFESNRGGAWDVYTVSLDTGLTSQITRGAGNNQIGSWSPDGRRLAILSDRDGVQKIYLVELSTGTSRRLNANPIAEGRPVFSHDGQYVYFSWQFESNLQVCRESIDGKNLANVTRSPYNDELCDVSADGKQLLIVSDRQSDPELYLVEVASASARRLTLNPGADRDGVFAPRPKTG